MYITAKMTPSVMPSAMAQAVVMTVLTRPFRMAGAVRNCATTFQAICPSAKAFTIQAKTAMMMTAATQRP